MGTPGLGSTIWSNVSSTASAAQQAVYVPIAGGLLGMKNFYDDHLGALPDRLGTPKPAPDGAKRVILVGGFMGDPNYMKVMRRSLEQDGFSVDVYAPANGVGTIKQAAKGLAQLVDREKDTSPGREVNIVTYSAGVSIARAYLSLTDADGNMDDHDRKHIAVHNTHKPVDTLVELDGSWHGDADPTWANVLGGPEWRDVQRNGPIMSALNSIPGDGLPAGTKVVAVHPAHSRSNGGDVDGAVNVHIGDDVSHMNLPRRSDEAYDAIRDALD